MRRSFKQRCGSWQLRPASFLCIISCLQKQPDLLSPINVLITPHFYYIFPPLSSSCSCSSLWGTLKNQFRNRIRNMGWKLPEPILSWNFHSSSFRSYALPDSPSHQSLSKCQPICHPQNNRFQCSLVIFQKRGTSLIFNTRSLGARWALTSVWRPFGPVWLRPSGAQAVWPMQHCIR